MGALLNVQQLSVGYHTPSGVSHALRNVSLEIMPGQVFGIVGESGSGKTTLASAIMRYLPSNGFLREGSIHFGGRDLKHVRQEEMRQIWGAELALVPQDPLSALNPSIRVGEQIAEILRRHRGLSEAQAARRSMDWMQRVHLADPAQMARSYPHQLSGGMQQRVMLAMAFCTEPKLLMLDEPTTNLDSTTQAAILDLLCELMQEHNTAAMYITHNLGVVAQICDALAVLYAGELVEQGPTQELFHQPLHPYTRGLLDSVPRLGRHKRKLRLQAIRGRIPALDALPQGCVFRPRCPLAIEVCEQDPPLFHVGERRQVRCHRWEAIADGQVKAGQPSPLAQPFPEPSNYEIAALKVTGLQVSFHSRRSTVAGLWRQTRRPARAVEDISFHIDPGEILGLVGESGSGKTTAARAILGLIRPDAGEIRIQDKILAPELRRRPLEVRRLLQMVFQDPQEAFNPYLRVGESLCRPLIRLLGMSPEAALIEAGRLLESVQLPSEYADRLPNTLSGGEMQRVAIARAFAASPALLLADEAVSALDVSVQAVILNLFGELQDSRGSATLFISHDLAAVGYLADRIAVIYSGQLMEVSQAEALFVPPYHPYTEALLSAIPVLDPVAQQERIRLSGEVPGRLEAQAGCPFFSRCPRRIGEICREQEPPWQEGMQGTLIYCHIPLDELRTVQKKVHSFSHEEAPIS